MFANLKKLIIKTLRDVADDIETGNCELSDEEASDILSVVSHRVLSKEQACIYLNCSRATFDNAIRDGLIPKGRKRQGFKELVWYKDELSNVLKR